MESEFLEKANEASTTIYNNIDSLLNSAMHFSDNGQKEEAAICLKKLSEISKMMREQTFKQNLYIDNILNMIHKNTESK